MSEYEVLIGDCLSSMSALPDQSVHCCVTSPPYFGLRDYGQEGQIGLEPTPDEFVEAIVAVFREVRRVLRDDGTVWLNLGDSYARTGGTDRKVSATAKAGNTRRSMDQIADRTSRAPSGLKDKDLIGIPWRVAFALQADGWYLRQDIIWAKPNPMPESVRDRCTKAHEYIFLLSKSPRYYYDHEAAKEPSSEPNRKRSDQFGGKKYKEGVWHSDGSIFTGSPTRNRRSVWTVTTRPYKGAHFATFPPALIEPCILAGCPEGGIVLDPFGGSGTTAGVAVAHKRKAIICELSQDYAQLIDERVASICRAITANRDAERQQDWVGT